MNYPSPLGALSANTPGQLHVLGHRCDSLGMDSTEVGVLEKTGQVGLGGFLQGAEGSSLDAEVVVVSLDNLANKALEGHLGDQKVGSLLVLADLTEGNRSRPPAVCFLDGTVRSNLWLAARLEGHKGGFLSTDSGSLMGLCLFGAGHYVLFYAFLSTGLARLMCCASLRNEQVAKASAVV